MAYFIKCDGCGVSEPDGGNNRRLPLAWAHITIARHTSSGGLSRAEETEGKRFDLCPSCSEQLWERALPDNHENWNAVEVSGE